LRVQILISAVELGDSCRRGGCGRSNPGPFASTSLACNGSGPRRWAIARASSTRSRSKAARLLRREIGLGVLPVVRQRRRISRELRDVPGPGCGAGRQPGRHDAQHEGKGACAGATSARGPRRATSGCLIDGHQSRLCSEEGFLTIVIGVRPRWAEFRKRHAPGRRASRGSVIPRVPRDVYRRARVTTGSSPAPRW
jgi:hypothetical protein